MQWNNCPVIPIEPPHHRPCPANLRASATESRFASRLQLLLQKNWLRQSDHAGDVAPLSTVAASMCRLALNGAALFEENVADIAHRGR
jgi:hypothetical protein